MAASPARICKDFIRRISGVPFLRVYDLLHRLMRQRGGGVGRNQTPMRRFVHGTMIRLPQQIRNDFVRSSQCHSTNIFRLWFPTANLSYSKAK